MKNPKDIKIIALDLDGTLLDSKKNLSAVNVDALARAAAKGAIIVPTTGRFFGMMPEPVRNLPFIRYAITVNGAQVYDSEADKAIVREEIPVKTAIEVMRLLDNYDVIYDCYRNNWGWITEAFKEKAQIYAPDEHYLKMIHEFRKSVPDLKAHLEATADEGNVQKIMVFAEKKNQEEIRAKITEQLNQRYPEIKVSSAVWNNLEINIESAHKGKSLERFAEYMGYTLDNCMAIGDGRNDLTMLEAAGIGVAMGNADGVVQKAADYVSLSNDENGVAAALEHFALA